MRLVILICLLSCFGICCAFQNSTAVKKLGEYPYVVSISRTSDKDTWYSGVLLTNEWILTSSQVVPSWVFDFEWFHIDAYAGTLTAFPKDGGAKYQQRKIINATRHPKPSPPREVKCPRFKNCWKPKNSDELVLFKVDKKFDETDYVKPAKLPTYREFVDNCKNMTIVGWCEDGEKRKSGSGLLKYVNATRMECSDSSLLDDSFFCVEYVGKVYQWPGSENAGQAIVCNGTLIGITQNYASEYRSIDIYGDLFPAGSASDINYYTSWIHEITGLKVAYNSTQHRSNGNQDEAAESTNDRSDTTRDAGSNGNQEAEESTNDRSDTTRDGGGGRSFSRSSFDGYSRLRTTRRKLRTPDPDESTPLRNYGSKLCPNFPMVISICILGLVKLTADFGH